MKMLLFNFNSSNFFPLLSDKKNSTCRPGQFTLRSATGNSSSLLIFSLIIINIFILCTTLACLASEHPAPSSKQQLDISNFRIKISRLQKEISNQEESISQTRAKEINILGELEKLDKKLTQQKNKLDTLEDKKLKQQTLIDAEAKALREIHSQKNHVKEHLKKRITAYYTMGDIGLLNVSFSTKTLPELLKFHDAFDALIRYDQNVIKAYKKTIRELEKAKKVLRLEKGVLLDFIHQTVEETAVLEKTRLQKNNLLTQVRTQTKLHQQAAREMQLASEKLSNSIVAIKNKNQLYEQSFLLNKGSLPPPVDGILITLFQQEKRNKLGVARKSNGIELRAPDGTKIIAVGNGNVIFAGYLRGYGNTVIIHHGFQYFTVT